MSTKSIAYFATAIILLVHLPSAPASLGKNGNLTRIVGGQPFFIKDVPYLVQIHKTGTFICGGTLVKPRIVVTACHCVTGSSPGQLLVFGGATRLSDIGVVATVSQIIKPQGFSLRNMDRDVAVLKLDTPLRGKNIKPIPLSTEAVARGMILQVSGWGLTRENAQRSPNQVRNMYVRILDKANCTAQYADVLPLTQTMFCAATPGVKDHCFGDSGSPAVYNGKLIGIVSLAVGCARPRYPGVYTGIRSVTPFLRQAMN